MPYELQQQHLQARGPIEQVFPAPRCLLIEEVKSFSLVMGVLTTHTPGRYDVGIRLNEEAGAWIYATGRAYHEMLEVYTQYDDVSLDEVLMKIMQSHFVGYYKLFTPEKVSALFPPAIRCKNCSQFYDAAGPRYCHEGLLHWWWRKWVSLTQ